MIEFFGYLIWLVVGIISIYIGAFIRYLFFNKEKRSFKTVSNDYFYYNFIVGVYIFISIVLIFKFIFK